MEAIEPFVEHCDLVLVMSVEPGFGGQSFIPTALDKLKAVRKMVSPETIVSVDGGIGLSTIQDTAIAGANLFVAGSSIFDMPDYVTAIADLHQLATIADSAT